MKVELETIGEVSDARYLAAIIEGDTRRARRNSNASEERLLRVFAAALAAGISRAEREGQEEAATDFAEVDLDQPIENLRESLDAAFAPRGGS